MHLYNHEMYPNFKFPFYGLESIKENYSQSMQDLFVLSVLNGKRNGTWLEIGCAYPKFISNTYLLESEFDWKGLSIDIDPDCINWFHNSGRKAELLVTDATLFNYHSPVVSKYGQRFDYLQLDVEPNTNTLKVLKKLPLYHYRFSVITYETDFYDPTHSNESNEAVRAESRAILAANGYEMVCGNICNMSHNDPFEDWWIDKTYIAPDIIDKFKRLDDSPILPTEYMMNL
jgi:hypothetical protein